MNKSLVRKTRILSLATLAALVSGQEGIEVSALLSGSRKRPVAKARGIFCQIAVKKLRYTGASVARYLGVTTSLVNRTAGEDEIAGLEGIMKVHFEPMSPVADCRFARLWPQHRISADTYIVSRFNRPCLYLCWCKGNESFLDVQLPNAV
jgi:hypothetical protein